MKYGGYTGKFLTVDLDSGDIGELPLDDELAEKYLGGRGFIAKLLYDLLPRQHRPARARERDHLRHGPGHGDDDPHRQPHRRRREEPADRHDLGELHGRPLRAGAQVRRLGRHHHHRRLRRSR